MLFCMLVIFVCLKTQDSGYVDKKAATEYVLNNHNAQTGAKNAVTAIYLNYRLFDTVFEAMLLMLSVLAVISFSWSDDHER